MLLCIIHYPQITAATSHKMCAWLTTGNTTDETSRRDTLWRPPVAIWLWASTLSKSVVFEGFPKIFAIILFNPKSGMPTTKPRKGPFPAAPKDEPSSTGFSVGTDCSETWRTGEVLKCWRTVVKKDVTHQFRNSIVLGFLKWRYPQIIRFSRMFTDFPLLW